MYSGSDSSKCCSRMQDRERRRVLRDMLDGSTDEVPDQKIPPICNIWVDWRSETDKYMQKVFCPLAVETDTNPNTPEYPDKISGGGWGAMPQVKEGYCAPCSMRSRGSGMVTDATSMRYTKY